MLVTTREREMEREMEGKHLGLEAAVVGQLLGLEHLEVLHDTVHVVTVCVSVATYRTRLSRSRWLKIMEENLPHHNFGYIAHEIVEPAVHARQHVDWLSKIS